MRHHQKAYVLSQRIHSQAIMRYNGYVQHQYHWKFLGCVQCSSVEAQQRFSSFIGSEVKAFINNIPKIVSFLKNKFLSIECLGSLIEGMEIWPSLVTFLSTTKIGIGEKDKYLDMLNTFEQNVKKYILQVGSLF